MLSERIKSAEVRGVGSLPLVPMIHFRSGEMSSGMLETVKCDDSTSKNLHSSGCLAALMIW